MLLYENEARKIGDPVFEKGFEEAVVEICEILEAPYTLFIIGDVKSYLFPCVFGKNEARQDAGINIIGKAVLPVKVQGENVQPSRRDRNSAVQIVCPDSAVRQAG